METKPKIETKFFVTAVSFCFPWLETLLFYYILFVGIKCCFRFLIKINFDKMFTRKMITYLSPAHYLLIFLFIFFLTFLFLFFFGLIACHQSPIILHALRYLKSLTLRSNFINSSNSFCFITST